MSASPSAALASQSRPPSSLATFADIEARIDRIIARPGDPEASAEELLQLGEQVLERWLEARGEVPTSGAEGRLSAARPAPAGSAGATLPSTPAARRAASSSITTI